MQRLNIDGQQLEVRQITVSETLAPIVFLHEGLGSISMWSQRGQDWPLAVCNATGRAGIVYSRRGYGQSETAPRRRDTSSPCRNVFTPDYMHREASDVLPALLAELNIEQPVLLGHSDGATIALLHTSQFPVTACIAMAPHVLLESVAVEAIGQAKMAFEFGDLRSRLSKFHADVDGAFWQWNDVWLSKGFASFDIRPECQQITAPLLLLQGLNVEYGTMRQLEAIAQAVPHAQQIRLADCGHSPHRDQPQVCIKNITTFLATLD